MPSRVSNRFALNALTAALENVTDVDMMLITNAQTAFDPDNNFVSDIVANEASVTGYSRQSVTINTTTQNNTNDRAEVDFGDVAFGALSTGETLRGAYLFNNAGGSDAAREILVWIEFAADTPTNGSTFTVQSAAEAVRATSI